MGSFICSAGRKSPKKYFFSYFVLLQMSDLGYEPVVNKQLIKKIFPENYIKLLDCLLFKMLVALCLNKVTNGDGSAI